MLSLHYWPTPNGKKITIFLEEAGVAYDIIPCNIGRGDQFDPSFLALNPNHRMPVLVDADPVGGGKPIAIFESGAILLYLAEKTGRFWSTDARTRWEITQWVVWQAANQGPKTGELGHFLRFGDKHGDQSYAVRRFEDEVNRIYGVLNTTASSISVPCRYQAPPVSSTFCCRCPTRLSTMPSRSRHRRASRSGARSRRSRARGAGAKPLIWSRVP